MKIFDAKKPGVSMAKIIITELVLLTAIAVGIAIL